MGYSLDLHILLTYLRIHSCICELLGKQFVIMLVVGIFRLSSSEAYRQRADARSDDIYAVSESLLGYHVAITCPGKFRMFR